MTPTPIRNLRVPDDEWAAWGTAARAAGVSVATFVRAATNRAAEGDLDLTVESVDAVLAAKADNPSPCRHPKSARDPKGYATFCSVDKGGCGARL